MKAVLYDMGEIDGGKEIEAYRVDLMVGDKRYQFYEEDGMLRVHGIFRLSIEPRAANAILLNQSDRI